MYRVCIQDYTLLPSFSHKSVTTMTLYCLLLLFYCFIPLVTTTYISTCHNDVECGSVCGYYTDDIVSPTDGMFGTQCHCQNHLDTKYLCTAFGYDIRVCSDHLPPICYTACGQKVHFSTPPFSPYPSFINTYLPYITF